ncbi:MAG: hypothetical protein PUA63_04340 [Oscillospiraceae bacterium]|nr:hypothetical protein [Oscillospiraceae bacterium]
MYHGNYKPQHQKAKRKGGKTGALLLSLLLIAALAVSGTVAYLLTKTEPVQNTFTPSNVTCKVTEEFTDNVKKNVNVTNTGNTDAYIRVKLVSYRVNSLGHHIGGTAPVSYTPSADSGWVLHTDGYYYYTIPVAPNGGFPANPLIGETGITLTGSYPDADGGKQVIEVMAEAIQSEPADAVGQSWGVSISENKVEAYNSTSNN